MFVCGRGTVSRENMGTPCNNTQKYDNRPATHAAHCLDAQYKRMRAVAMTLLNNMEPVAEHP